MCGRYPVTCVKEGFSREVAEVITTSFRKSAATLSQGKWSRFPYHNVEGIFLHARLLFSRWLTFSSIFCKKLMFTVPAIKWCRAAHNHVFALTGTDLAANRIICMMFSSFEKDCLPRQIKLPEWNLILVLRSLTHLLYELLIHSSDKHFAWKTCVLLAFILAKRASELHGLLYQVRHSIGWKSCTFSFVLEFMAKT